MTNLTGQSYSTNFTAANGLQFTGVTTNWNVSYPLLANNIYRINISATDVNGGAASTNVFFDTCNPAFTWEAEDYNHDHGQFMDNAAPDAYAGLGATPGVDIYDPNIASGGLAYRPSGQNTEVTTDIPRLNYLATGAADYDVSWNNIGNWANYTRTIPPGTFNLYLRAANGSASTGSASAALVISTDTTTSQTISNLGTFAIPDTGRSQAWTWVPLRDGANNLVRLDGGGVKTVRITSGGGYNANFYALFPVATPPLLAGVFPSGSNMVISFPALSNFNYQVQYKNNLTDPSWLPLGSPMVGNGSTNTIMDTTTNARFYRVIAQ
jgi:hypothetical protein